MSIKKCHMDSKYWKKISLQLQTTIKLMERILSQDGVAELVTDDGTYNIAPAREKKAP